MKISRRKTLITSVEKLKKMGAKAKNPYPKVLSIEPIRGS
jgi:hypothetical protein